MATVVQNPSYGTALGEALGGLGGALLGQQYGMGLAKQLEEEQYQKGREREEEQFQTKQTRFKDLLQTEQFQNLPLEEKMGLASYIFGKDVGAAYGEAEKLRIEEKKAAKKAQEDQMKAIKEQIDAQLLAKVRSGQQLTPQEEALLSPTSQRTLLGLTKPQFEPTEEKLEAERVSKLADQVEKDYANYKMEDARLSKMENLDKKGNLTTPLMNKTLQYFGLPIGVLQNPDSEEFEKIRADYVRDVNDVFRGQIRVFEIESYMKTIPGLVNTPEGRKAIIKNRRLINEAKKIRYDAYKQILKENDGKKPRNLGILIEERTGDQINSIMEEFKGNINDAIQPYMPDFRVRGPDGKIRKIPANRLEDALSNGGELING